MQNPNRQKMRMDFELNIRAGLASETTARTESVTLEPSQTRLEPQLHLNIVRRSGEPRAVSHLTSLQEFTVDERYFISCTNTKLTGSVGICLNVCPASNCCSSLTLLSHDAKLTLSEAIAA